MTLEQGVDGNSSLSPGIDWTRYLVPKTENRSKALYEHRPVLEKAYRDVKKFAEIKQESEVIHTFQTIEKIVDMTIAHAISEETQPMLPAETYFRYLRTFEPKRFERICSLEMNRNSINLRSILYQLGQDPQWIKDKRMPKPSKK